MCARQLVLPINIAILYYSGMSADVATTIVVNLLCLCTWFDYLVNGGDIEWVAFAINCSDCNCQFLPLCQYHRWLLRYCPDSQQHIVLQGFLCHINDWILLSDSLFTTKMLLIMLMLVPHYYYFSMKPIHNSCFTAIAVYLKVKF